MHTLVQNRGLLKPGRKFVVDIRFYALLMVVLMVSMSGSIAYASNSIQPDLSKMSNELISELESQDELEAVSYTHLTLPTILRV